jgi:hypothetical protein
MMMILKILTMPIWLPLKILWFFSKVLAVIILIIVIGILCYIAIHVL